MNDEVPYYVAVVDSLRQIRDLENRLCESCRPFPVLAFSSIREFLQKLESKHLQHMVPWLVVFGASALEGNTLRCIRKDIRKQIPDATMSVWTSQPNREELDDLVKCGVIKRKDIIPWTEGNALGGLREFISRESDNLRKSRIYQILLKVRWSDWPKQSTHGYADYAKGKRNPVKLCCCVFGYPAAWTLALKLLSGGVLESVPDKCAKALRFLCERIMVFAGGLRVAGAKMIGYLFNRRTLRYGTIAAILVVCVSGALTIGFEKGFIQSPWKSVLTMIFNSVLWVSGVVLCLLSLVHNQLRDDDDQNKKKLS